MALPGQKVRSVDVEVTVGVPILASSSAELAVASFLGRRVEMVDVAIVVEVGF